ncbi:hypothetical protein DAEQUDRAFT_761027 [Daedalea quercina L-15889]|uniref:Guanine nucleotide-binding protein-like 1 n=1 Tax=Daedalea quercina L-15889 TaxID=1314783 RepID=A0A165UKM8_9APHY|nr:hypothetical protein DAEQUDRAFT_761027 [Daedalea quercina L-15889]
MPPHKKPFSAKQKKEQLQLKRAVKSSDTGPPPKLDRHGRPQKSSLGNRDHEASSSAADLRCVSPPRIHSSYNYPATSRATHAGSPPSFSGTEYQTGLPAQRNLPSTPSLPPTSTRMTTTMRTTLDVSKTTEVATWHIEEGGTAAIRATLPPLPRCPLFPSAFRRTLVAALRDAHAELLTPPEYVRTLRSDAAKLARWRPHVQCEVDWDVVLEAESVQADDREGPPPEDSEDGEPEFLTIGLIGKSSLLNALFGRCEVKASRTPGKTTRFPAPFWTPGVRLVDCPGLVMPSFVLTKTRVLAAILPISRVSAVALCRHHTARFLPLERILQLAHPALASPLPEDLRT